MSIGSPDPEAAKPVAKRVCLLTGSSGVLGSRFCAAAATEYDIAAVYRHNHPWFPSQDSWFIDPLEPHKELEENRHPLFAIKADLTADGSCERVVETTLARFGRIDVVVNGAVASTWAPMLRSEALVRSAKTQLTTNVLVPLNLAVAVAKLFWQGRDDENRLKNRNVINVSSVAGTRLCTGLGQSIYAASKAALNLLTFHMADEFTSVGVRVNALAPNSFRSTISVDRAVAAIRMLDESTSNGSIVLVDGGEGRRS